MVMARCVVPVVVVLALVGGYVVGQQPPESKFIEPNRGDSPTTIIIEKQPPNDVDAINYLSTTLQVAAPSNGQVGRFVPFEVGKLLDTTNGSLYAMEGNPTKWKVIATMTSGPPGEVELRTIKPQRGDAGR